MLSDEQLDEIKQILISKKYASKENDLIQNLYEDYLILRNKYFYEDQP